MFDHRQMIGDGPVYPTMRWRELDCLSICTLHLFKFMGEGDNQCFVFQEFLCVAKVEPSIPWKNEPNMVILCCTRVAPKQRSVNA